MKTIESQLDLFFQRLRHTPGPWRYDYEYVRAKATDGSHHGNIVAYTNNVPVLSDEIKESNGILISCTPSMLRTICRTYLWSLIYLPFDVRATIHGQGILSDLRSAIADATNLEGQEVQDTFEGYAHELKTTV